LALNHGLSRLSTDIARGSRVFCVCTVGRDYHIGARDAFALLQQAAERGVLVADGGDANSDEIVYVPTNPSPKLAKRLKQDEAHCRREIAKAHQYLRNAYPDYYPEAGGLAKQKEPIHDSLVRAFELLQDWNWLPARMGTITYNHQSMVLIMSTVFADRRDLTAFLQNPEEFANASEVFCGHSVIEATEIAHLLSDLSINVLGYLDPEMVPKGEISKDALAKQAENCATLAMNSNRGDLGYLISARRVSDSIRDSLSKTAKKLGVDLGHD